VTTQGTPSFFVRQSAPNTCIAACVCMLLRRRGKQVDEADLIREWGQPPYTCALEGSTAGRYYSLDPDAHLNHEFLRARLRDRWLLVTLMPQPGHIAHAVVLIGLAGTWLAYLDPAEDPNLQPRAMTEDNFFLLWTGELVEPSV